MAPHLGADLLILLNHQGRPEGLEFDDARSQSGAAAETICGGGFTQCSVVVVAPSIYTRGTRQQLGGSPVFLHQCLREGGNVGFLLAGIYSVRLSDTIPSCPGTGPKNAVSTTTAFSVAGVFMSLISTGYSGHIIRVWHRLRSLSGKPDRQRVRCPQHNFQRVYSGIWPMIGNHAT